MSVKFSTNKGPSEDLDLNSDAAPVEEADDVCRVSVAESAGLGSVGNLNERGSDDGVRVCEVGDDQVVQLEEERTDVHGEAVVVDQVRVSGCEDVNMECSVLEQTEVVEMVKEEKILEKNDEGLDGTSFCSENMSLEDEAVTASIKSVQNVTVSVGGEKQETVTGVDEMGCKQVYGGERMGTNVKMESKVVIESNEVKGEPNSDWVKESSDRLQDGMLDRNSYGAICHASEDKRMKAEIEFVEVGCSTVEQFQGAKREVAAMDAAEVLEAQHKVSETSAKDSAHVLGVIPETSHERDVSLKVDISMQDIEPDKVIPVAENTSNQVELDVVHHNEEQAEKFQGDGEVVTVDVDQHSKATYGVSVTNVADSADALGRSTESLQHQDVPPKEDTSMRGTEQGKVSAVAETTSNLVKLEIQDEEGSEGGDVKTRGLVFISETSAEQIQGGVGGGLAATEGMNATNDVSKSNVVVSSDVLGGSQISLQNRDISPEEDTPRHDIKLEKAAPVAETTFNQVELEFQSTANHVWEDKERAEIEVAKGGSSASVTDTFAEKLQVVGAEVATMDVGKVMKARFGVVESNTGNLVDAVSGSPESLQHQDISPPEEIHEGKIIAYTSKPTSRQVELEVHNISCRASEDEERAAMEVGKVGSSTSATETVAEQTLGVVGRGVEAMDVGESLKVTYEVSETNAVDLVHELGGSPGTSQHQDIYPEKDISTQDTEPEIVAPIAERFYNRVECHTSEVEELAEKVVKTGSITLMADMMTEQIQTLVSGEVAGVDVSEGLKSRCEVLKTDTVDLVDLLGGRPKSLQHQDVSPEQCTSLLDNEPEEVALAAETTSNQVKQQVHATRLHAPEDREQAKIEVGSSITISEMLSKPNQVVFEGEVQALPHEEILKTDGVSEIIVMDLNQADAGGKGFESFSHEYLCPEKDTSMQDLESEKVAPTTETESYQVESRVWPTTCHAAEDGEQKTEIERSSILIAQTLAGKVADNEEAPEKSGDLSKPNADERLSGNLGSLTHENISPNENTSPEKISPLFETSNQIEPEAPATICRASEYEEQNAGILSVQEGNLIFITNRSDEEIQAVIGKELVLMDGEVSKNRDEVSETDDGDRNQAGAIGGSLESFPDEDLPKKENTSMQDTEADEVPAVTEVTVGSQSMGSCASLHGEDLPDSTLVTESVRPLERVLSHSEFQFTVIHDSEVEEPKSTVADAHIGNSTVVVESLVEKTEADVGDGIGLMDKEEVSEMKGEVSDIDAMDEKLTFIEENQSLETAVLGGSVELFPDENRSCKEDTSMQDVKQDTVVHVPKTGSNLLDGGERTGSHSVEESLKEGDYVTGNSKSLVEIDDPGFIPINESVKALESGNADSEVQGTEGRVSRDDEHMNHGKEISNVRSATVITKLLAEQLQNVTEREVAPVDDVKHTEVQDELLRADALHGNNSMEKSQLLGAEVVSPSSEFFANGNLTRKVFISAEVEKQAKFARVGETVFGRIDGDERKYTHPFEENLDETIVNSKSVVETVDVSQAKCASASPCGDAESDSARVTRSFGTSAEVNLDLEVQATKDHTSLPDIDQNVVILVYEAGTSTGETSQTMQIGEIENQAVGSNGSELGASKQSNKGTIMDNADGNLNSLPDTDGNMNTPDGVIKQDTSLPNESYREVVKTKNMGNEAGLPGLARLNEKAAEEEGEFSDYDLVWGKVKSHPWWPGQIFHSSDASERAMKYQKKDGFLVAYFGDQTFAWNGASKLKPFRAHFPQMEKQSSSESFRTAVNFALAEVSRRVELGMICSCMPREACAKVKSQITENAGIREEARSRDGMDKSLSVSSFKPDKLVRNVKALALCQYDGADKLELAIAHAQLVAFYRLKGYSRLPEFHVYGGLVENDAVSSIPGEIRHPLEEFERETPVLRNGEPESSGKARSKRRNNSAKRKYFSDESVHPTRKERSLSELMNEKKASPNRRNGRRVGSNAKACSKSASSSGKKRKGFDSFSDDREKKSRKHIHSPSRDADIKSPTPPTFKVGDCIRRVAPSILKCSGDRFQKTAAKVGESSEKPDVVGGSPYTPDRSHKRRVVIPEEDSCLDGNLSQLSLAARDPHTRVIQGSPEEQPSHRNRSGGGSQLETPAGKNSPSVEANDYHLLDSALVSQKQNLDDDLNQEKPARKYQRRKRKSQVVLPLDENATSASKKLNLGGRNSVEKIVNNFNENNYVDEFCPTALIMSFAEVDSVPSEMKLNRIFSRFGPLKESETEVLGESNSARVVFKKRTDAEVAFSSAGKFSIFGPAIVTYQLNYLSSSTCRAYSDPSTQIRKDAASVQADTS